MTCWSVPGVGSCPCSVPREFTKSPPPPPHPAGLLPCAEDPLAVLGWTGWIRASIAVYVPFFACLRVSEGGGGWRDRWRGGGNLERKETRKINFLLQTQPPRQPGEQSVSLRCWHDNGSMCERGKRRRRRNRKVQCQQGCLWRRRRQPSRAHRGWQRKDGKPWGFPKGRAAVPQFTQAKESLPGMRRLTCGLFLSLSPQVQMGTLHMLKSLFY